MAFMAEESRSIKQNVFLHSEVSLAEWSSSSITGAIRSWLRFLGALFCIVLSALTLPFGEECQQLVELKD